MSINLKRRDGVQQSASLPSTRTVISWFGAWKQVDFERKYSLEKVYRSHNGFEITNLTFISFGNNLGCTIQYNTIQYNTIHHLFIHVTPRSTEDSLKRARAAKISTGKLVHLK